MPWTPESVFEADHDVLDEWLPSDGEYEFRVKGISVWVRIRLYKKRGHKGVYFKQSHFIKTPLLMGKYTTNVRWGNDVGTALRRAVTAITGAYRSAIKAGKTPEDTWLVPNEDLD